MIGEGVLATGGREAGILERGTRTGRGTEEAPLEICQSPWWAERVGTVPGSLCANLACVALSDSGPCVSHASVQSGCVATAEWVCVCCGLTLLPGSTQVATLGIKCLEKGEESAVWRRTQVLGDSAG